MAARPARVADDEQLGRPGKVVERRSGSSPNHAAANTESRLPYPDPLEGPIRVFLLDDHDIVRRRIAGLLDAAPHLEVVGEAGTAAQARARIPAARPDVALLDVRLPDGAASTSVASSVSVSPMSEA